MLWVMLLRWNRRRAAPSPASAVANTAIEAGSGAGVNSNATLFNDRDWLPEKPNESMFSVTVNVSEFPTVTMLNVSEAEVDPGFTLIEVGVPAGVKALSLEVTSLSSVGELAVPVMVSSTEEIPLLPGSGVTVMVKIRVSFTLLKRLPL